MYDSEKDSVSGEKSKGLTRQLSLFDSTMIMVGIVLGSGIFLTTGYIASSIPSASLIMLAWIFGGLLTLAGALTYAELGASMPETGGQYVYLREAYHPIVSFVFGWIMFFIYMTGTIAAMAVAFAEYFGYFFPNLSLQHVLFKIPLGDSFSLTFSSGKIVALTVTLFLTVINIMRKRFGFTLQNVFTVIKIGTLLVIIVLGFSIGKGTTIDFSINPGHFDIGTLIIGFGVAMVAVFWTFEGWNNINFVAGEIKNPSKNLPLVLIGGTLIVTILYALVNYIYLYALPISEMQGVERIAEKATTVLFGGTTAAIISATVLVSTFGALNGCVLAGPRVYYAMAKDGLFFRQVARIHPKYNTPAFSFGVQLIWASLLIITGTFNQLITFVMFIAIILWIVATASVFTLRKKYPDLPRPYKTWGYPVMPVLFIVAAAGIVLNTLIEKPVEALAGVGLTVIAVPTYFLWKRKRVSL